MDITHLPEDVQNTIALDIPLEALDRLCLANKTFNRNVCQSDRFWHRRYLYDYGDDFNRFGDISGMNWRQIYIRRRDLNRVWQFGNSGVHTPALDIDTRYAKRVASSVVDAGLYDANVLCMIGMDNSLDVIVGNHTSHLDGDFIDILIWDEAIYTIDVENNVMFSEINTDIDLNIPGFRGVYTEVDLINPGWPKAIQMVPFYHGVMLVDINNNILLAWDDRDLIITTGVKVKYIDLGVYCTAMIDLDDNVWYSTNIRYPRFNPSHVDWKRFGDIKGKTLACDGHGIIVIDLDGNVWAYGEHNNSGNLGVGDYNGRLSPTKVEGIIGEKVFMDSGSTIIIDTDHNLWRFGDNSDNRLQLGTDVESIPTPVKLPGFKALDVDLGSPGYAYIIGNYVDTP